MLSADQIRKVLEERNKQRTHSDKQITDIREEMWKLHDKGELTVIPITDRNKPVRVETLFGWEKQIPTDYLWHHKSCGQCGNIPGYPASLLWFMNKFEVHYLNEPHQTSCTAWNYHGTGTSNPVALAAVAVRNWYRAYETGTFPLIHCGTSYGDYKEMRKLLIERKEVREKVREIMRHMDKDLVIPEEIVHYSEWVHVMRERMAHMKKYDLSSITATVHEPCHYYKMVPEDAIYDASVEGGQRPAPPTALLLSLGMPVADYSTWYDCCGFGFRHILTEREFTRSFATLRKIKPMVEEAHTDVIITTDTGCVTTLDKSQWVGKVHGMDFMAPVLADVQLAALAAGAHPYKIVQVHWHASPVEKLMEKMGIDYQHYKEDFMAYLESIKNGGKVEFLYEPHSEMEKYFAVNKGQIIEADEEKKE
ncbi:MAG: heterodisulfide reductase-related iron-sulfur binding cluster [Methanomassiliicoccales archaeon]